MKIEIEFNGNEAEALVAKNVLQNCVNKLTFENLKFVGELANKAKINESIKKNRIKMKMLL